MPVVTISRQVGSLGDEAARALSQELDFHLVTAKEIRELAISYDPSFASGAKDLEEEHGLGLLERLFFAQPVYTSLYEAVILELASQRRVIILGRGAQVVLKDVPQVLRVRVVAPTRVRVARLGRDLGITDEEARDWVSRHDQERRALVRQIFDHDLRDWGLYHLVLNTEGLDQAGAANIIRQAISEIERLHPLEDVSRRLARLALAKRVEARLRSELLRSNLLKAELDPKGRILLSGYLHTDKEREKAGRLSAELAGPVEVLNDIKVSAFSFTWPA